MLSSHPVRAEGGMTRQNLGSNPSSGPDMRYLMPYTQSHQGCELGSLTSKVLDLEDDPAP